MTQDNTDVSTQQTEGAENEPLVLTPDVLEQLLLGCYWEILKRMRQVGLQELTSDQAAESDDVMARHLARTLMGENDGFIVQLPRQGMAIVEGVKAQLPLHFTADALAGVDTENPRAMMVYVCRLFVRECYHSITAVGSRPDFKPEMMREESMAHSALWRRHLCQLPESMS